jgi:hypothetical protein
MRMKVLRNLAIGLSLAVVAHGAHAEGQAPNGAGPSAPAAAKPSAKSLELAQRMVAAVHMEATFSKMLESMLPVMSEQVARSNPGLTAEQRRAIQEATLEASPAMMRSLIARAIPIYAEVYTEDELTSIVAFYEAPAGQAMVAKIPQVSAKLAPSLRDVMPEFQAEMMVRLCAKIDCSGIKRSSSSPRAS